MASPVAFNGPVEAWLEDMSPELASYVASQAEEHASRHPYNPQAIEQARRLRAHAQALAARAATQQAAHAQQQQQQGTDVPMTGPLGEWGSGSIPGVTAVPSHLPGVTPTPTPPVSLSHIQGNMFSAPAGALVPPALEQRFPHGPPC